MQDCSRKWQQWLMYSIEMCLKKRVCVRVCVCVLYVHVSRISLHYFVATLTGLPGGRDTHSSASSHMKAPDPLSLPLRSQGAHQRRGEKGWGEEGRRVERGSDGANAARILQGLPELPTLKACTSIICLRERVSLLAPGNLAGSPCPL